MKKMLLSHKNEFSLRSKNNKNNIFWDADERENLNGFFTHSKGVHILHFVSFRPYFLKSWENRKVSWGDASNKQATETLF